MTTRSLIVVSVAAISLSATIDVSAETRPRYGRTITASLLGKPAVLDPAAATTHSELTVADLLFDGLYRVDSNGRIDVELATALPELSEDKLVATIPIRVGAYFHDGKRLQTDDVVRSFARLKKSSSSWLLGAIESVAAAEGNAVILRLRYPEPRLARLLASPRLAITRKGKKPSYRKPIGTGPYSFRRLDHKRREIALRAFDKHHRGRAYLDQLKLRWYPKPDGEARAYELGELQVSLRGDVAFSGQTPKYETLSKESRATVMAYLGFGRSNPAILSDRDFRRAVSLALSREGLAKLGSGETAVPTLRPDTRSQGAPAPRKSNTSAQLDRARAALSAAARRVPGLRQTRRLNLEILVNRSRLDDIDIADKVLAALDKLGVGATVALVSAQVFDKRVRRGACDLFIGQSASPPGGQSAALAAAFALGGDGWAKKRLQSAPLDLPSAVSEFRRRLPVVPLFHRGVRAHYRSDVFGLEFGSSSQLEWADMFLFGSPKKN